MGYTEIIMAEPPPLPSSSLFLLIGCFCIALIVRAIFSFLETSITALRLFKLKELAQQLSEYDALFQALEKNPHSVLMTILIANSVTDVVAAALSTEITEIACVRLGLSTGLGFSLGIGMASVAIIIFGEIIPKNLARRRGEDIFHYLLGLINFMFRIMHPITSLLVKFTNFVAEKLSGKPTGSDGDWVSSEKEVRFMIDYIHQKGLIDPDKTAMLKNIFELEHTYVRDVMIPATDVVSISAQTSIQGTLDIFLKYHYTRLPIYEGSRDNVIGMVHQKDIFELLTKTEQKPLKEIIRPIMFIPESVKVSQLLQEFRAQQMHIAIVLNEHGSVTGLITLEDALEEIVGDISDEHEAAANHIVVLKQGGWLVNASMPLEELEKYFKTRFETESSVTLGGFLTEQLTHVPKKGERVIYKTLVFQVQKASHKRVRQVLITRHQEGKGQKNKK
jgi:magnesium and cobalt exporter, CNNM family